MIDETNKVKEFWNKRAELKETSGTNDYMLKALELKIILDNIHGGHVLDVGCGNGRTLVELAIKRGCVGTGIDFSKEMIKHANEIRIMNRLEHKISFSEGSIPGLKVLELFDNIITERCLINLIPEQQYKAFDEIMQHLKVGGTYLMIESFCGGLRNTNNMRVKLGLDKILPPWHNYFLDEGVVKTWENNHYKLEEVVPFTSTYYFLSRVINGKLAAMHEREPQYDDDVNKISMQLPPIGNFGAVQLWIWRKV